MAAAAAMGALLRTMRCCGGGFAGAVGRTTGAFVGASGAFFASVKRCFPYAAAYAAESLMARSNVSPALTTTERAAEVVQVP